MGDRLNQFINQCHRSDFAYGAFDCMDFTATCVFLSTGQDFSHWYKQKYTSRLSAAKWLKKSGFRTLEEAVTKTLEEAGWYEVWPPTSMRNGDVFLTTIPRACGYQYGLHALAPTKHGLRAVSMSLIHKVWRA